MGRTSHDRFPGIILCTKHTDEVRGGCLGVHLGWSGNYRLRIDLLADGRSVLQAGEYFFPGEMILAEGQRYTTPNLYAQFNPDGLSALSNQFHDYYHDVLCASKVRESVRPVHYNTWEGIYFDHKPTELMRLADRAAEIGVERFVLDDGWFIGRRHDGAGLGDWRVDRTVYPNGLQPIIDHVNATGMEFGLWVEPEMINKDSDLYREHPDWILNADPAPHVPFRNQFVLDLARPEVSENIFTQLNELLTEYPKIGYLKWDMNRDLSHPGGGDGRASVHRQTKAVYSLIQRLSENHPHVEIESCSSGGARADYGILSCTDRIWTSDSNDALDRQRIQRGASFFFPLSVIGAHVGPRDCHITGRHLSMDIRAATALFGHMGVEANLIDMPDEDRDTLTQAITLYKENRILLHRGDLVRLEGPHWQNSIGVVSKDRSAALFSCAITGSIPNVLPGVLKFRGLDEDCTYRLRLIWPSVIKTGHPHRPDLENLLGDGLIAGGDILQQVGLQLPALIPETCLVFAINAV